MRVKTIFAIFLVVLNGSVINAMACMETLQKANKVMEFSRLYAGVRVMMISATFNNISVAISFINIIHLNVGGLIILLAVRPGFQLYRVKVDTRPNRDKCHRYACI